MSWCCFCGQILWGRHSLEDELIFLLKFLIILGLKVTLAGDWASISFKKI